MTNSDETQKLIEFIEFTADNIAVVAEQLRTKWYKHFHNSLSFIILGDIQKHCRIIKQLAERLKEDARKD